MVVRKKTSAKTKRKSTRKQSAHSSKNLLGSALDERVTTGNFRTRQKFGAASDVRKVEITDEMRKLYENK